MFTRYFWVGLIGCLGLLMSDGREVDGQERAATLVPKLSDLREHYRRQKNDLKELSVKWVLKYEPQVDPAIARKIDGTTDYLILDVHAAFKGAKRLYDQRYRLASGKQDFMGGLNRTALAYDGQTTQWYRGFWNPQAMKGNWARLTSGDTTNQFAADDEYMAWQGLPKSYFRILGEPGSEAIDLAEFLRDDVFQVDPNLQSAADGIPCVLVKGGQESLWFDPKRAFVLRQRAWRHSEQPWLALRLRFADHVECTPGVWLAKTMYADVFCDPTEYPVLSGRPYKTGVLRVTELKVGSIPDSLFRLQLEPGVWVEDASRLPTIPSEGIPLVNYTIPSNPSDLDQIIQQATEARAEADRLDARRAAFTKWVAIGNVVVVCTLVAIWLYRHYKDRRAGRIAEGGSTSDSPQA